MSNQQEKLLFSQRLKQTLNEAKHPISPTYLAKEFNLRYDGQPISVQSANNWLLGKAIPNQDKLLLLAIWLNVSNQWLRFGDDKIQHSAESTSNDIDWQYFLKYQQLNPHQKNIIQLLINEWFEK